MAFEKEKYIAELFSKYVQGTITPGESKDLDEWRNSGASNQEMFDRMLSREEFENNIQRFVKSGRQTAREWNRIEQRGPGRRKFRRSMILRYAAAAAIFAVCFISIYTLREKSYEAGVTAENNIIRAESTPILLLGDGRKVELTPEVNDLLKTDRHVTVDPDAMSVVYDGTETPPVPFIHTLLIPKGSDYRIILSDGTVVFMNAESSLTYPSAFVNGERRVQLNGEAYFAVADDVHRPFIVEAGEIEVLVTGTRFGVRAYSDDHIVRTVLESGGVNVSAGGQNLVLTPDMQAVYDRQTKSITLGTADAATLLAWRNGRFAYDGSTLEEIFTDLARWYDFTVTYAEEDTRYLRYSLDMRKHETFASILNIIRATQKVDFEVTGTNVVVKKMKK